MDGFLIIDILTEGYFYPFKENTYKFKIISGTKETIIAERIK